MSQSKHPDGARGRPSTDSGKKDPREDVIAQKLRGLYDEVARQPVPDRFVELLDKLAEAEEGKRK
jgi:hypothetical protein